MQIRQNCFKNLLGFRWRPSGECIFGTRHSKRRRQVRGSASQIVPADLQVGRSPFWLLLRQKFSNSCVKILPDPASDRVICLCANQLIAKLQVPSDFTEQTGILQARQGLCRWTGSNVTRGV